MKDCTECSNFRRDLLIRLDNDMTIGFEEWFFIWLKKLDNTEFMKEIFMNNTINTRIPYDIKLSIKNHVEKVHIIKLAKL